MWKENLYQPVEILLREHDEFPIGAHLHSFFEVTYILEGQGNLQVHTAEDQTEEYNYTTHDLYLVPPNKVHLFTTTTHSRYMFIRFTDNYVSDYLGHYIDNSLNIQSGFQIKTGTSDADALLKIIGLITAEMNNRRRLTNLLLQYYVNSLILIMDRCLSASVPEYSHTENHKAQYMLQYIQQHLHQPELLKLPLLAEKFHLSANYAGRFFKRNFGEDFKQYLSQSRLRKVEEMLVNTQMSIKEIADYMGYADACYLTRQFEQHYHTSPLKFRKKYAQSSISINR